MLPLEPLFVDRSIELAEFDHLLAELANGHRRHFALMGLRRIGKTMLLDEVRRRHPTLGIAYVPLDELLGTPEDFAWGIATGTIAAARVVMGLPQLTSETRNEIEESATQLHSDIRPILMNITQLMDRGPGYSALLAAAMRFPAQVSQIVNIPLLWMLDEFQEVTRLLTYPGTENLLGTIRAALDRPGKVAFVIAGSRVSALRNLIGNSESPLFTRFEQLELYPFAPAATAELCERLWDEDGLSYDPDAEVRLHRLTGGWPFYTHAVAARARLLSRTTNGKITDLLIDTAFQQEMFGRSANIGQNCRYLMETALSTEKDELHNTIEAVMRQTARLQPVSRTSIVRRLKRHHSQAQIYRAINRLIDTDFLQESQGLLSLLDPVFGLWLRIDPARRDPVSGMADLAGFQRLLAQLEAQHAQDRQEMGALFERRIENLVRQFHGQTVDGRLFGIEGDLILPNVSDAGSMHFNDPDGQFGDAPDSYEVDVVAMANPAQDSWAIEAKHRRGAITNAMIARFYRNAQAVSKARGIPFARLWIVAERGVRADAQIAARAAGIMYSGLRQIEKLERLFSANFDVSFNSGE